MTIRHPHNATTSDGKWLIENSVSEELRSQFDVTAPNQLADHIMYFYPPGVMTGFALGYVGGYLTLFDAE